MITVIRPALPRQPWKKGSGKYAEYQRGWYHENRVRLLQESRARIHKTRLQRPWHRLLLSAKTRANVRKQIFELDEIWAKSRWTGFCELSGIAFKWPIVRGQSPFFLPTIDQINPKLGYRKDNCRFILFALNAFRGLESDQVMLDICRAVIQRELYQ